MLIIGSGGHRSVIDDVILLSYHRGADDTAFVAIGNNADRKCEAEVPRSKFHPFAILQHPHSFVSRSARIGAGTVIMAGAVVQANAHIGAHCIINSGATVDHDCVLEDFVHIAPGAHLCGGVHVGEGALVGVGVGIEPGVKIPAWSIVKRVPYEISQIPTNR